MDVWGMQEWYLWHLYMIFICVDGGTTAKRWLRNLAILGAKISDRIILEGTSELARVLVARSRPIKLFLDPRDCPKLYFIQTPSN